jgi:threonine dehydratase
MSKTALKGMETHPVTPLEAYPKLAKAIGVDKLYFKREDLHPYGSHKGRSIPVMIDQYLKAGDRRFAISSSGNAALAAALHIKKLGARSLELGVKSANSPVIPAKAGIQSQTTDNEEPISLDIFIGQHASPHKAARLKELADEHIRVLIKERPLQALTQAVNEGVRSLRQSTDDTALIGYESLARELASNPAFQNRSDLSVFIGTSSGTTSQALAAYFLKEKLPIQIHIVQTSSCHPLADAFESYDGPDEASLADAITDITARRKDALIPLIKKTGGRSWVATNDDIKAAQELTSKNTGLEISTNSALSVAGAMKAVELGYELGETVVCMICGE